MTINISDITLEAIFTRKELLKLQEFGKALLVHPLEESVRVIKDKSSQANSNATNSKRNLSSKEEMARKAAGKKNGFDISYREDDSSVVDVKPTSKGTTTAHLNKLINELLDLTDENEDLKSNYLVMDNASIHKSKPMIRKIEARDYRVMYLPPYSPELNPIEQFWSLANGKMKHNSFMKEEALSSRIGGASANIH
ncbi:hypothetical protein RO3G_16400 [Rhizopus delemar RA 99-880]|uniref:Tc1-like transposase DDE domain-containing protein n=1 Tax=Rhizopus delemar (strain RA 99-880 / ATCC MYA-4621 / FGSC 9543 / NRRL 43880) TaxID=246409 RepID=I1CTA9_RHIO9|nr:hypothetical protein RO3G_16400 [Rhizopus delemar RA 99-880]|eukprot:EIE91689.1 hypothetical protein RO3G_16400 [Rhizopus delemar RA 99-880]